jgi:hypothetical protein
MTELETNLRAALHERAARIHASPDLLATDYHPRARRVRPSVAICVGLAVAVGATAAALSLGDGASNAFAGWTPQPTRATRGQLSSAEAYCAKNVPTPGLPLKLTDTRGPFTFLVYSDGSSNDFCTLGPSFTNASGWSTSSPVTVPAGRLFLWAEHTMSDSGGTRTQAGTFSYAGAGDRVNATNMTHVSGGRTTTDSGQAYTFLIAQAGDGVTAADLTLDDGTEVTATVDNGWAVAWWPGSHQLTSAQLTTPSGTQTQTFPVSPCGLHNCKGGAHGSAPGGGPGGG